MPRRVREGDLFAVPFAEHRVAVGIVLHKSSYIRDGIIVGFYPQTFPGVDAIDVSALAGPFIATPNYTGRAILAMGDWPTIGHRPDLLARATIPHLRIVHDLYYKDTHVRHLEDWEVREYQELLFYSRSAVEGMLRDYFCPPATNDPPPGEDGGIHVEHGSRRGP
jgi:hypothetical protein